MAKRKGRVQEGDEEASERGRKGAEARWEGKPAGEGPLNLLADMERMLTTSAQEDVTPLQKSLRKLYRDKFLAFMELLAREREVGKGEEKGVRQAVEPTDEEKGWRERVRKVNREIIEEMEAEDLKLKP